MYNWRRKTPKSLKAFIPIKDKNAIQDGLPHLSFHKDAIVLGVYYKAGIHIDRSGAHSLHPGNEMQACFRLKVNRMR